MRKIKPPTSIHYRNLSRREFLKAAMITGVAGMVAACSQSSSTGPAPALSSTATSASIPTPTSVSTLLPPSSARPEIIRFYPQLPKSKVIHTSHSGVWKGTPRGNTPEDNELLSPQALGEMLDTSIT